jgi:hypothetical protein
MSKLMNFEKLDTNKITYSDPKSIGSGKIQSKQIYVNYAGSSILLHTPIMKLPFGMSKYQTDKNVPAKYTLNLSFDGMERNEKMKEFYNKILEFEQKIKEDMKKNSVAWMNKSHMTNESIENCFTSCIKFSKDKETGKKSTKFAPTMHLKIPFYNNNFGLTLFDENTNEVDFDEKSIVKGSSGIAIIKCNGIWTSTHGFGCNWKLEQLKMESSTKNSNISPQTYAFIDDD